MNIARITGKVGENKLSDISLSLDHLQVMSKSETGIAIIFNYPNYRQDIFFDKIADRDATYEKVLWLWTTDGRRTTRTD